MSIKGIYKLNMCVDVILESCPITTLVILNLLLYNNCTIQYSTKAIRVYDSNCHRTIPHTVVLVLL